MCNAMSPMLNSIRAAARLLLLVLWIVSMIGLASFVYYTRLEKIRAPVVRFFYRVCCMIFGLRITVEGVIAPNRPLLLISNHTTYLDIPVMGSLVNLSFTPKSEIRSWPVIGYLGVLADCVYIERRPAYMQQAATEMREKLAAGKVLSIFGEGTTTDGVHLKPFKSGFMSLAIEEELPVQPISLAYTHFGDRRIADDNREEVAWVGDATFFRHFWHVLSQPSVRIHVKVHPLIPPHTYGDRKTLTLACEKMVATGVAELMAKARNP